jgi:hypothetical protein
MPPTTSLLFAEEALHTIRNSWVPLLADEPRREQFSVGYELEARLDEIVGEVEPSVRTSRDIRRIR